MHQHTVAIASRSGLHARPAALFVKAAARHGARAAVEELAELLARDLDAAV
ncbi:HPr family phosphocarrier protein [Streptomyces sp. NPDC098077]|uniref:HPr family phosphocarrier protein n=1 Tax=Streptomyces sp. NPDC098077 TaxID=3366093 RepID=UPI0038272B29